MATQHLIELGHREIACIQPASPDTPSGLRVKGYQQAMKTAGLVTHKELMPRGDNRVSGGKMAIQALVESKLPFSAIFSANDAMAIGAMRALRELGYQIPENVSITGVDDIILASYSEPPLTTVSQPKYDAGCQAVNFLIERIQGCCSDEPRKVVLDIQLVQRNSCIPFNETILLNR